MPSFAGNGVSKTFFSGFYDALRREDYHVERTERVLGVTAGNGTRARVEVTPSKGRLLCRVNHPADSQTVIMEVRRNDGGEASPSVIETIRDTKFPRMEVTIHQR